MSAKQDRVGARTPSDLERKYNFGERFAEIIGIATDARVAAEKAESAVSDLDNELSADEIFNRLTNDGEEQGIYREDGKIYVNASYIKTGEFLADLIKAGVLQSKDGKSFYLDLDNGVLKMHATELTIGADGKSVEDVASSIALDAVDGAVSGALAEARGYADEVSFAYASQEDVFNKLTDNGALPGLFMENGQLYINADYLASGVIASKDGSIRIDLSGVSQPVFNTGISTDGISVRGDVGGAKEVFSAKAVKTEQVQEPYFDMKVKSASDQKTIARLVETFTNNYTENAGAAFLLKSPNERFELRLEALDSTVGGNATVRFFYNGVEFGKVGFINFRGGLPTLEVRSNNGLVLNGFEISFVPNGDGTYALIGREVGAVL